MNIKKSSGIITLVLILMIIGVFFDKIVNFIINIQWFSEVGYLSVYFTKLIAISKLMIPLFFLLFICIMLYYKIIVKNITSVDNVIQLKSNKKFGSNFILLLINVIISGIISYGVASNYWYSILQFTNSKDFNIKDPIFNIDISFFVFKLPLIQSLYGVIITLLMFFVFITAGVYIAVNIKDSMKSKSSKKIFLNFSLIKNKFTKFATKQLALAMLVVFLMLALGFLLKAFSLVYSTNGVVFGGNYTDVKVSLVFFKVIIAIAIISSVVVFVSVLKGRLKPIVICIVSIILLTITQGIAAAVVQKFIVNSNQITFETKYIKDNIDYTRKAFNIESIDQENYDLTNNLKKEDITTNKDIIDNIKVNSFRPALDFYNQVQVIRYYYGFNDIDVDRYNINGKYNQVFIAAREIDSDAIEPNNWQNKHLIYTHGYGVVMSKVNSVTAEGQPNFVIKDVPPVNSTDIALENPRIYFGEKTNYYAVVDTNRDEFDYPKGGENAVSNYDGEAGIQMSLLNRLLFSIRERNFDFILSRDISSESKILINRNVVDRAKAIAPFLTYDKDPYLVISEGKLYWVMDGYTTSDKYPYSEPVNGINYIRNSVKVIIDAYSGETNFYIVDKEDPIINSYASIFKDLFKDGDTLSQDMKDHFRYPEDMYNVQCSVLGKYHATDPKVFLTGEDLWQIATDQNVEGDETVNEASYVVMKLPKSDSVEMVLLEYFNMRGKENMTAMLAARMDDGNYGKMTLYKFPSNQTVYSPQLFQKKINQDTVISKEISLWQGKGSTVSYGETIIIPINNSLLYVEPMYLIADGENSIPEMKRVIVSYGEKVVLAESIDKALEQLFNVSSGSSSTSTGGSQDNAVSDDLGAKARELYEKAIEAQKNGDWASYGNYIKELGDILDQISK